MRERILFAALWAVLLAGSVTASEEPSLYQTQCDRHFEIDERTPPEIADYLRTNPEYMVEHCINPSRPDSTDYYVGGSPVWQSERGVCHFVTQNLHLHNARLVTAEKYEEETNNAAEFGFTQTFLSAGGGSCPQRFDASYVRAEEISDGLYLMILGFWEKITSDAEEFESAFEEVPRRDGQFYADLKDDILSRDPRRARLSRIVAPLGRVYESEENMRRDSLAFGMNILDYLLYVDTDPGAYLLHVDIVDSRLKVVQSSYFWTPCAVGCGQ